MDISVEQFADALVKSGVATDEQALNLIDHLAPLAREADAAPAITAGTDIRWPTVPNQS